MAKVISEATDDEVSRARTRWLGGEEKSTRPYQLCIVVVNDEGDTLDEEVCIESYFETAADALAAARELEAFALDHATHDEEPKGMAPRQ